jgi:hypothetical protein
VDVDLEAAGVEPGDDALELGGRVDQIAAEGAAEWINVR